MLRNFWAEDDLLQNVHRELHPVWMQDASCLQQQYLAWNFRGKVPFSDMKHTDQLLLAGKHLEGNLDISCTGQWWIRCQSTIFCNRYSTILWTVFCFRSFRGTQLTRTQHNLMSFLPKFAPSLCRNTKFRQRICSFFVHIPKHSIKIELWAHWKHVSMDCIRLSGPFFCVEGTFSVCEENHAASSENWYLHVVQNTKMDPGQRLSSRMNRFGEFTFRYWGPKFLICRNGNSSIPRFKLKKNRTQRKAQR